MSRRAKVYETHPRTIHLDDALWDWLREYAESIDATMSDVIRTRLVDLHDDVEEELHHWSKR